MPAPAPRSAQPAPTHAPPAAKLDVSDVSPSSSLSEEEDGDEEGEEDVEQAITSRLHKLPTLQRQLKRVSEAQARKKKRFYPISARSVQQLVTHNDTDNNDYRDFDYDDFREEPDDGDYAHDPSNARFKTSFVTAMDCEPPGHHLAQPTRLVPTPLSASLRAHPGLVHSSFPVMLPKDLQWALIGPQTLRFKQTNAFLISNDGIGFNSILQHLTQDNDVTGGAAMLLMENWLEAYLAEKTFGTSTTFLQIKLNELQQITTHLPQPHPLRTWIFCDMLLKMAASSEPHTARVFGALLETLLPAIYTSKESDFGFLMHSTRARLMQQRLDKMVKKRDTMVAKSLDAQKRWGAVVERWLPAMLRGMEYWNLTVKTIAFCHWRLWANVRKHREKPFRTWFGRNHPGFMQTLEKIRNRFCLRSASICFVNWKKLTSLSKIENIKKTQQQLRGGHEDLVCQVRHRTRLKYQMTEQMKELEIVLDKSIRRERVIKNRAEECDVILEELTVQVPETAAIVKSFSESLCLLFQTLEQSIRHLYMANLQDPSEVLEKMGIKSSHHRDGEDDHLNSDSDDDEEIFTRHQRDMGSNGGLNKLRMIQAGNKKKLLALRDSASISKTKSFKNSVSGRRESMSDRRSAFRGSTQKLRTTALQPINEKEEGVQMLDGWLTFQLEQAMILKRNFPISQNADRKLAITQNVNDQILTGVHYGVDGGVLFLLPVVRARCRQYYALGKPDQMAAFKTHRPHYLSYPHLMELIQMCQTRFEFERATTQWETAQRQRKIDAEVLKYKTEAELFAALDALLGNTNLTEEQLAMKKRKLNSKLENNRAQFLLHDKQNEDKRRALRYAEEVKERERAKKKRDKQKLHNQIAQKVWLNSLYSLMEVPEIMSDDYNDKYIEFDPFIERALTLIELNFNTNEEQKKKMRQLSMQSSEDKKKRGNLSPKKAITHKSTVARRGKSAGEKKMEKRKDTSIELDPDFSHGVTVWLATLYPGLPHDYDDLYLQAEELREMTNDKTYDIEAMKQSVVVCAHIRKDLAKQHVTSLQDHAEWKRLAQTAENYVHTRLMRRIRQYNGGKQKKKTGASSQQMGQYTAIRDLLKRLISREPPPLGGVAEEEELDPLAAELATLKKMMEITKTTKKTKDQITINNELNTCELVLGKWNNDLRELFNESAADQYLMVGEDSPPPSSMSNFQFIKLVRAAQIPSNTCTPEMVDHMYITHLANIEQERKKKEESKEAERENKPRSPMHRQASRSSPNPKNAPKIEEEKDFAVDFDGFVGLCARLAHAKFRKIPRLDQRMVRLFKSHLFLASNAEAQSAHDFREQLSKSSAEYIFERHNTWLNGTFCAYANKGKRKELKLGEVLTMSETDFQEFVADTGMVEFQTISFRIVKNLFDHAQMDGAGRDLYADDKVMVFWEFLEACAALSTFMYRNPYVALETRLENFIVTLKSNEQIERVRHQHQLFFKPDAAKERFKKKKLPPTNPNAGGGTNV